MGMCCKIWWLTLLVWLAGLPLAAAADDFSLPSFEQVRAAHVSSDAVLLDRNGQVLSDLRIDLKVRRLDWVPLTALTPAMREALLRAEDRRFFEHSGVDWLAFAGAAWQNLWYTNKRGASTLTMQLAGLIDPALHMPSGKGERRSYGQKWDQSRAALELEHKWSKAQILEAYLNLAPFRGDLQGVSAASELLFGVPAHQISPREATLLAALLRGPNARAGVVAQRACHLAETLGRGSLCPEISHLATTRLDLPRNQPRQVLAPHLARLLLQHPGQRVQTLLDAAMQARLLSALNHLGDPRAGGVLLDNVSGEMLAWVGAVSPAEPDGVSPHRMVNEWNWLVHTALVLDQRQLTLVSPIPLGWAVYDPRDAWAATPTWMSLHAALLGHQNGAMLYVQSFNSHEAYLERTHARGIDENPDGMTLPQLAAAWRCFAAGGQYLPPRGLPGDPNPGPRKVWHPETAFLLQDLYAGIGAGGWQSVWAGTTGEDGATVLVGNTDRHTLALVVHTAAPLSAMRSVLSAIDMDSRAPAVPDGVVGMTVHFEPPLEADRREWFLHGTELGIVTVLPDGKRARITFPAQGESYVVADNLAEREHWALTADTSVALHWQLDGKPLGDGARQVWMPVPGSHRLTVTGLSDQVLDSVDFEVHAADSPQPSPPETDAQ